MEEQRLRKESVVEGFRKRGRVANGWWLRNRLAVHHFRKHGKLVEEQRLRKESEEEEFRNRKSPAEGGRMAEVTYRE